MPTSTRSSGRSRAGNRSIELDAGTLEAGTYPYVLSTPDDEAVGRLVVEDETAGETSESEGESESDGSDESEPSDEDGGSEDGGETNDSDSAESADESNGDDSDDPGLPSEVVGLLGAFAGAVGTEHAVGGAAVVGAAHVLGYWA